MKKMTSTQLRDAYLDFFRTKQHAVISSSSLIPENDPSVLFTTAGMHPLVPYLLGERHPQGKRLTNVQKCVRTGDIDDVGDNRHCTFFEMLGNWSLGDYFKHDSIAYSFEFLTKVLEIPLDKLSVTCFAGDEDCERDIESAERWQELGLPKEQIYFLPKEHNWWWAGPTGPCGPDTEMFVDMGKAPCSPTCSPACSCGKYIEIWNNVFMQYSRNKDGKIEPLSQKNVDTGMGLERTLCIINDKETVFETDIFATAIVKICELAHVTYGENEITTKAIRVIADHVRSATFIMGDDKGVAPSNVDQGYIVRRVIRRAIRYAITINFPPQGLQEIAKVYIEQFKEAYPELKRNEERVLDELKLEEERFSKTVSSGLKELQKVMNFVPNKVISGKTAFRLYDTFGFPLEMTIEISKEDGFSVDTDGYNIAFAEHQAKSSVGAEQKFKGGLQDSSEATTKLHTATHIMLASLKKVLADDTIVQKGSNITPERLRFDFNFSRPMTTDEIKAVEKCVNDVIAAKMDITCQELTIERAHEEGATGTFGSRYGEIVKVYTIGDYSKEICGGPHATNTGDLGIFEIQKEQSSSSGVRRIKAILK